MWKTAEYGISPLHCKVKCIAFILKLAYTLPRSEETKTDNTSRENIQNIQQFFRKLGFKVDCPKHGYGNTNDENTFKKFFENVEVTTQITGVNYEILKRLPAILNVLNCKEMKRKRKSAKKYAQETA